MTQETKITTQIMGRRSEGKRTVWEIKTPNKRFERIFTGKSNVFGIILTPETKGFQEIKNGDFLFISPLKEIKIDGESVKPIGVKVKRTGVRKSYELKVPEIKQLILKTGQSKHDFELLEKKAAEFWKSDNEVALIKFKKMKIKVKEEKVKKVEEKPPEKEKVEEKKEEKEVRKEKPEGEVRKRVEEARVEEKPKEKVEKEVKIVEKAEDKRIKTVKGPAEEAEELVKKQLEEVEEKEEVSLETLQEEIKSLNKSRNWLLVSVVAMFTLLMFSIFKKEDRENTKLLQMSHIRNLETKINDLEREVEKLQLESKDVTDKIKDEWERVQAERKNVEHKKKMIEIEKEADEKAKEAYKKYKRDQGIVGKVKRLLGFGPKKPELKEPEEERQED